MGIWVVTSSYYVICVYVQVYLWSGYLLFTPISTIYIQGKLTRIIFMRLPFHMKMVWNLVRISCEKVIHILISCEENLQFSCENHAIFVLIKTYYMYTFHVIIMRILKNQYKYITTRMKSISRWTHLHKLLT